MENRTDFNRPVSDHVARESVPVSGQVAGESVEKHGTVRESVPVSGQVAGESVEKHGTVRESVPVSGQVAGESVEKHRTKPVSDEVVGESLAKHGTKLMGPPAPPETHPHNQQAAAVWGPHRGDDESPYMPPHNGDKESPYVERSPVQKPGGSPMENILDAFNSWNKKSHTLASNVWDHLRTAPSKTDAAWGKLQLAAKTITGGGFESLFRQAFDNEPSERLKKTFACYLSTSTGPVAGTLYLSNVKIAFCSDRPLSFTAPSGQEAWSYYKVVVPLSKVAAVNPVIMKPALESPAPEKYVQVVTVDGHEFWFMGFVNYDKAGKHLSDAVSDYTATAGGVAPAVAAAAAGGVAPAVVGE